MMMTTTISHTSIFLNRFSTMNSYSNNTFNTWSERRFQYDNASQCNVGNSTTAIPKTDRHRNVYGWLIADCVKDFYCRAQSHHNYPLICENAHEVSKLVLLKVLRLPTSKITSPIFTISIIRQKTSLRAMMYLNTKRYILALFSWTSKSVSKQVILLFPGRQTPSRSAQIDTQ